MGSCGRERLPSQVAQRLYPLEAASFPRPNGLARRCRNCPQSMLKFQASSVCRATAQRGSSARAGRLSAVPIRKGSRPKSHAKQKVMRASRLSGRRRARSTTPESGAASMDSGCEKSVAVWLCRMAAVLLILSGRGALATRVPAVARRTLSCSVRVGSLFVGRCLPANPWFVLAHGQNATQNVSAIIRPWQLGTPSFGSTSSASRVNVSATITAGLHQCGRHRSKKGKDPAPPRVPGNARFLAARHRIGAAALAEPQT